MVEAFELLSLMQDKLENFPLYASSRISSGAIPSKELSPIRVILISLQGNLSQITKLADMDHIGRRQIIA